MKRIAFAILLLVGCYPQLSYTQGADSVLTRIEPVVHNLQLPLYSPDISLENLPLGRGHPVARDTFGTIHIVYPELTISGPDTSMGIYYTRFDPANGPIPAFEPILIDTYSDATVPADPTINVDRDNNVHIVWVAGNDSSSPDYRIRYLNAIYQEDTGTWEWSNVTTLFESPFLAGSPAFAARLIENELFLHCVFVTFNNISTQIGYFRYHFDDEPNPPEFDFQVISEDYVISLYPQITLDADQVPHVVWMDNISGEYEIKYRQGPHPNGDALWTEPIVNISTSTNFSGFPAIAMDPNGNGHIIWTEFGLSDLGVLKYRQIQRTTHQLSQITNLQSDPSYFHSSDHQIAISNRNDVHVMWSSYEIEGDFEDPEFVAPRLFYAVKRNGMGWQPLGSQRLEQVYEPDWRTYSVATRSDAKGELDLVWIRQNRDDLSQNQLMYGNISYNDSPDPPENVVLSAPHVDPIGQIPTTDDTLGFEKIEWYYEDIENDSLRFYHIQVANNPSFDLPLFNVIDSIEPAVPSGSDYTLYFDPGIFEEDPDWMNLPDGIYNYRMRVGDALLPDDVGGFVINWSPWSRGRHIFRFDDTPPTDLQLTIGNIRLGTPNATITYEDTVRIHLAAVDSSVFRVRLWGMVGHATPDQADTVFVTDDLRVKLLPGDDIKYIYAQFFDALNHQSDVVRDSIYLDQNHIVVPERDTEIIVPERRDDGIPDNDTRLRIPAGAVKDTLIITPVTVAQLAPNTPVLDPDLLPTVSEHPRIDSELVESVKFLVHHYRTQRPITNLQFRQPVELVVHYDPQALLDADVEPSQADNLKIFHWDGANWVFLGGEAQAENQVVYLDNLTFLPTSPTLDSDLQDQVLQPDLGIFKAESGVLNRITQLSVRPNPFTPNGDGYNDLVYFDFGRAFDFQDPDRSISLTIKLYDERGFLVRTIHGDDENPIVWDGRDDYQRALEGGIYFYQIQLLEQTHSGTLVLIR